MLDKDVCGLGHFALRATWDEFNCLTEAMFDYCCCGDEERVMKKRLERGNDRVLIREMVLGTRRRVQGSAGWNGGVRMFILQNDVVCGGHSDPPSPPKRRRCT